MRVLIALDSTSSSLRAARAAVRLFGDLGTEFLVINVATPMPWIAAGAPLYPSSAVLPAFEAPDERAVRDLVRQAGIPEAETISTAGTPVEGIVEAADAHDVDVIVVGGHDKGMLERILEPSVSQGVVRATHRPVLVVSGDPPGDDTDTS